MSATVTPSPIESTKAQRLYDLSRSLYTQLELQQMKVAYRYDQCDIYFGGRLQKYTGSPTEGTVKLLTAVKGRGVYKDVNEVHLITHTEFARLKAAEQKWWKVHGNAAGSHAEKAEAANASARAGYPGV